MQKVCARMQSYTAEEERGYRGEGSVAIRLYLPPCGSLTLLLSHARPSKMPSPVVAQLGSTFQTWSLAILSSCSLSETSFGRMAGVC